MVAFSFVVKTKKECLLHYILRLRSDLMMLTPIASSPGPSQLFSLTGKKRERTWYLKLCDKRWKNGVALATLQSVDFKPAWHLWSIKCSSVGSPRIVLPLLISVFFTCIEPECSKITLAHAQFSWSTTLQSSYPSRVYGPTSCM